MLSDLGRESPFIRNFGCQKFSVLSDPGAPNIRNLSGSLAIENVGTPNLALWVTQHLVGGCGWEVPVSGVTQHRNLRQKHSAECTRKSQLKTARSTRSTNTQRGRVVIAHEDHGNIRATSKTATKRNAAPQ